MQAAAQAAYQVLLLELLVLLPFCAWQQIQQALRAALYPAGPCPCHSSWASPRCALWLAQVGARATSLLWAQLSVSRMALAAAALVCAPLFGFRLLSASAGVAASASSGSALLTAAAAAVLWYLSLIHI